MDIGRRVCQQSTHRTSSSCAGTVRYIGSVGQAGAGCWAGVEWDDPTYGKHDGEFDGHRYFWCSKLWEDKDEENGNKNRSLWQTSASFLPINSPKFNFGMSFYDALKARYSTTIATDPPVFIGRSSEDLSSVMTKQQNPLRGSRLVTIVGADVAESYFHNFYMLDTIDLSEYHVASIGQCLESAVPDSAHDGASIAKLASDVPSGYPQLPTPTLPTPTLPTPTLPTPTLPTPTFPRIKFLSLSNNLLPSFSHVIELMYLMPSLDTLVLSHSRFPRGDTGCSCRISRSLPQQLPSAEDLDKLVPWRGLTETVQFKSVKHLIIRATGAEWVDLLILSEVFPDLETLDVSSNPQLFDNLSSAWLESKIGGINKFSNVTTLLSQENQIRKWKWMFRLLKMMPSICNLSLNENQLCDEEIEKEQAATKLEELGIEYNCISSWKTLSAIATLFPYISRLRWSGNPLHQNANISCVLDKHAAASPDVGQTSSSFLTGLQLARQIVTCLFPNLTTLNGGPVLSVDRKHAELYFLSLCAREPSRPLLTCVDPNHAIRDRLETAHRTGLFEFVTAANSLEAAKQAKLAAANPLVTIRLIPACSTAFGKPEINRSIASWLKVGDLKKLCQRIFQIPTSRIRLNLMPSKGATGVIELLDESCTLNFYGVTDKSSIMVGDIHELEQEYIHK